MSTFCFENSLHLPMWSSFIFGEKTLQWVVFLVLCAQKLFPYDYEEKGSLRSGEVMETYSGTTVGTLERDSWVDQVWEARFSASDWFSKDTVIASRPDLYSQTVAILWCGQKTRRPAQAFWLPNLQYLHPSGISVQGPWRDHYCLCDFGMLIMNTDW